MFKLISQIISLFGVHCVTKGLSKMTEKFWTDIHVRYKLIKKEQNNKHINITIILIWIFQIIALFGVPCVTRGLSKSDNDIKKWHEMVIQIFMLKVFNSWGLKRNEKIVQGHKYLISIEIILKQCDVKHLL